MFIIGERINGMFKKVAQAVKDGDKRFIQDLAKKQVEAGASALDVNVGPSVSDPKSAMDWLVKTIAEVTDVPLAIDTTKISVLEVGLKACKNKSIINSTSGSDEKLNAILPLAKKYNASVIGLTMDESGVPQDAAARTELAAKILSKALEYEINMEDLYIDAVILPVNVAQPHAEAVLETIRQCKILSDPPPKTILGLSNVSQGSLGRSLINRTYLVMAVASGLDAAIMDSLDKELMDSMITAELLLNKQIYCDSYLDAYRKK